MWKKNLSGKSGHADISYFDTINTGDERGSIWSKPDISELLMAFCLFLQ